jgi:hypothetical protein
MIEKLLQLIAGGILLTFGKKLFWLFVGCIGFVLAFNYAETITGFQEPWAIILIATFAGIVGAMMAIFLQGVAIAVGGFLAGGMVVWSFLNLMGFYGNHYFWIAHIVGGIIGLIMMLFIFDWAIIILSSIIGAVVIIDTFYFSPPVRTLLFMILSMTGVAIQANIAQKTAS